MRRRNIFHADEHHAGKRTEGQRAGYALGRVASLAALGKVTDAQDRGPDLVPQINEGLQRAAHLGVLVAVASYGRNYRVRNQQSDVTDSARGLSQFAHIGRRIERAM